MRQIVTAEGFGTVAQELLDFARGVKARVLQAPGNWLRWWATLEVLRRTGCVVASGPFIGMMFVERHVFGAPMAKLLGTYEKELHGVIEAFAAGQFDGVVNIGAGEGYYAVGLARRLPNVRVVAYEILEEGRGLIRTVARKNAIGDQLDLRGMCDREALESLLDGGKKYLIVCDVEGAEVELFGPSVIQLLWRSLLIVETHDFRVPGCTEELAQRFEKTHVVTTIVSKDRRAGDCPLPLLVPRRTKVWVMEEGRPREPAPMRWLVMTPRLG